MQRTMKPRRRRRIIWLISSLLLLVVAVLVAVPWLEHAVLERTERILRRACGYSSSVSFASVEIHPLRGDVKWTDLRIAQPEADPDTALGDRAMRVSGAVEEIAIQGLSIWRLLFAESMSMRTITIIHPDIEVILMNDSTAKEQGGTVELSSLDADRVVIEGAVFRMHRTGDSLELRVDTLGLHLSGLRARWGEEAPFNVLFDSVAAAVRGLRATLPPLYDLRIAALDLDEGGTAFRATDATIRPRRGPQQYDRTIHFETDLFDAHLDTAAVTGLDLLALINERTVSMSGMRIAGVDLDVYRDKTMPDPPFKEKALPARLLRELPMPVRVDSLVLDRWTVHYSEKNTLTPDFGEVRFNEIHAMVTGINTLHPEAGDTMAVMATGRGYDRAAVTLQLRTVISDPSDRFTAAATIKGIRFDVFDRMTADLLLVRSTSGTIGGVDMSMSANNDRARGRVDMEYDNLKIELLKRDLSGERRRFLSGLVHMVVHKRNLRSDPEFRHGDFTVERRKDRSIFNYLWSGLREGMVATVLPEVVADIRKSGK
ncbi:MAG: hypothetical protein IPL52_03495 [Flavobacteriales bacterium]|nr:hypothetical protein [Flavobacteriales bacterium]